MDRRRQGRRGGTWEESCPDLGKVVRVTCTQSRRWRWAQEPDLSRPRTGKERKRQLGVKSVRFRGCWAICLPHCSQSSCWESSGILGRGERGLEGEHSLSSHRNGGILNLEREKRGST